MYPELRVAKKQATRRREVDAEADQRPNRANHRDKGLHRIWRGLREAH
jgi:hypothetical protein